MTTLVEDIADYLDDQGLGTVQTDIFYNNMPDTPDNCLAVYAYAGQAPPTTWDAEYPSIQVKVRNTDSIDAYELAYSVFTTLHRLTNPSMTSTKDYYYIYATQSPAMMGKDANGRYEFVVNFNVIKEI